MPWEIATILLLLAGFALAWLAKKLDLDLGDAAKSVLLVFPTVIFLLGSGRIAQFELLGVKATIAQIAKQPVESAQAHTIAIEQTAATSPDFDFDAMWLACRPYYVMSEATAYSDGKLDPRKIYRIARAIYFSITCGQFKALVVLGKDNKPVGYFERDMFLGLLRLRLVVYDAALPSDEEIVAGIRETELGPILQYPVERAQAEGSKFTIPADTKLEEALGKFQESGQQTAILLDRRGRFDGVVTRQTVAEKLLADLFRELKK